MPLTGPDGAVQAGHGATGPGRCCPTSAINSIAAEYPFNITGPCTSYFQSHNFAGTAVSNALFCREEYVQAGQFATVGECVNYFDQLLGG